MLLQFRLEVRPRPCLTVYDNGYQVQVPDSTRSPESTSGLDWECSAEYSGAGRRDGLAERRGPEQPDRRDARRADYLVAPNRVRG